LFLVTLAAVPQQGDRAGETQTAVVPRELIPPAPVLTPDEELKSFKLQPGFRAELVAAEPLVHDPIQIAFDPKGRLWVLEMSGFMPNPDAIGEFEKVGRVAVLDDKDGDGRMDHRTVFLDGLVLPRAIALVRDGILVAEPPVLWFCRDTDGDDKCDEKTEVAKDYATQADPKLGSRANPEHASNGLLSAIDNWIYSANHTTRFRSVDGEIWRREPTVFRGQWGISQDNFGRLFYNSNEDPLRADLVPSAYLSRNPHLRKPAGLNVQLYEDKTVWPIRVNPGVNRGYRKGQLRPDGTLATFTAACAPLVYRGDNFPADHVGDVFVCEPSANLVRRFAVADDGVRLQATNACGKSEFLASTDERFRPVNLANGPDGCLYVVDFYRGIIQHRIYLTSYLRGQSLDRGLDKPTGLGRIFRIVSDSKKPGPKPQLDRNYTPRLIKSLSHPNGWWRDTAQRLLVEQQDPKATATLKQLARVGTEPLGRLHALWTLEGCQQLDPATLQAALADTRPEIRSAAIRLSETSLKNHPGLLNAVLALVEDPEERVRLQLALTLGEVKDARAATALAALLARHPGNPYLRDAVLTGVPGRELEMLEGLLGNPDWRNPAAGRGEALKRLAVCVTAEGKGNRVARLLVLADNAAAHPVWQRTAILDGLIDSAQAIKTRKVRLPANPPFLATRQNDPEVEARSQRIYDLVTWAGKPGETEVVISPLSLQEKKRFESGRELFAASCAACHQPHGRGQDGLAPPLADSEWVLGSPQRLARITLHGVRGRISVAGQTYDLDMPSFGVLDDEQIAAVLTYIRREWDHGADPVKPEFVKGVRAETAQREDAWSEAELLKVP